MKKLVFVLAAMILLLVVAIFFRGTITGLVASPGPGLIEEIIELKKTFSESTEHVLPAEGVKAIKITGKYSGKGSAKVYANLGSTTLLIFESDKNIEESSFITGMVTGVENFIEFNESLNFYETDENNETSDVEELFNETTNESISPENDTFNETINVTEEINETITIEDIVNETNETQEELINEEQENSTEEDTEEEIPEHDSDIYFEFTEACMETCDLIEPVNIISLFVEVEDAEITIDEVVLFKLTGEEFFLISNFSNRTMKKGERIILDLSEKFSDDDAYFDSSTSEGLKTVFDRHLMEIQALEEGSWPLVIYAFKDDVYVQSNTFYVSVSPDVGEELNETNETVQQNLSESETQIDSRVLDALNRGEKVRIIVKNNENDEFIYVEDEFQARGKGFQDEKTNNARNKDEILEKIRNVAESKIDVENMKGKVFLAGNFSELIEVKAKTKEYKSLMVGTDELADLLSSEQIEKVFLDEEFFSLTIDAINITKINEAQSSGRTGQNVKVCIIDTGLEAFVIETGQNIIGYNFVEGNEDFSDDNGHGTKVTYALSQAAPGADLIIAKVLDAQGNGYASDVIAGMEYCEENNADIISSSIGGGGFDGYCVEDLVALKVDELSESGIATFAATGNDGNSFVKSPACATKAIPVASTNKQDALSTFSNFNGATLLVAPGQNIQTKNIAGETITETGTSMSVPFVSGAAALVLENESLTPSDLKYRIVRTGEIIEHPIDENNNFRMFSRLNAYNAINNIITNNLTEGNVYVAYGQAQNFTGLASTGYEGGRVVYDDAESGGTVEWVDHSEATVFDNISAYTATEFNSSVFDWQVKLIINGTVSTNDNKATREQLRAADTEYIYGGSTDLWGETLTSSDINSAYFGAAIAFADEASTESYFLAARDFGVTIPAGATISGVQMKTEYFFDEDDALVKVDAIHLNVHYAEAVSSKGNKTSWTWQTLTGSGSGQVMSGSKTSWSWLTENASSGRMIRNGTKTNWSWVPE